MANEFKVKKGLIVDGSGTVVDIQGTAGQLFSVTDSLTGDLFSVSDISGVPILNVNSSGLVEVDNNLKVSGPQAEIHNLGNDTTAKLVLSGHNNTGTPGVKTNGTIEHRGEHLKTVITHNGSDVITIGTGTQTTFAGTIASKEISIKQSDDSGFDGGLTVERSANTQKVHIGMDGGAVNFNSPDGLSYKFRNNGTEKFTVDSSGNVTTNGGQILTPSGVNLALNPNTGVVAVAGVLDVNGTGNSTFAGPVYITPPSSTGWQGLTITGSGTSHTQGAIVIKSSTSDTPEARGQGVFMFNEGDDVTWYTGTQYQDADTWMLGRKAGTSLDTSAATSAQAFLEVGSNGYVGMGIENTNNQRLTLAEADANGSHLKMNNARSGGGYWVMGVGDTNSSSSIVDPGGLFLYNGSTKFKISSAGNTTFAGNITSQAIKVDQTGSDAGLHIGRSDMNSSNFATTNNAIFFGDELPSGSYRHQASISALREAWSNSPTSLVFKTSATVNGATTALTLNSSQNASFEGHIILAGSKYLEFSGMGKLINMDVSSWNSGAQEHNMLYSGWTANTGDYLSIKVAGNGTTAHGNLIIGDNGLWYGRMNTTDSAAATNSATNPHSGSGSNYFRVDTSGNASFAGTVTGGNGTFTNLTISATEKLRFDGAGGHTYISEASDSNLKFYVAATEVANFTNDNINFQKNLSVHTSTTPRYQLDLAKLNNASQTDYLALGVNNGPGTGDGTALGTGIVWKANYSGYSKRSAGIMQVAEGNYFRSGLAFYTNNATSTSSDWIQRMDLNMDGKLTLEGSDANVGTVLDVQGTAGQLFSVTNSLSGDLFSVSDVSGVPILNVNSSGLVEIDGNIALNGALKTYNSNVTSVIALDDNSSLFTRADETYLAQNFYYNSSDAGKAIEAGYSTVLRLTEGAFYIYGTAASVSADASTSLQERFKIDTNGIVGMGSTGIYAATNAQLNLPGKGIAIKNDRNGSNNNWSYIYNTGTSSQANLDFVTGVGTALTLNHDKSATFTNNVYSLTRVQGGNSLIGSNTISSTTFATFGSNSSGVGVALARDHNANTYKDLIINSSGNVALGTASHAAITGNVRTLTIDGTNANVSGGIVLKANGTNVQSWYWESNNMRYQNIGNYSHTFYKNNSTVLFTIATSGTVTATGDVVAYSDEKLKTDIKTLDGSKVYEMRGVSFIKDEKEGSGVIAQELEKVAPELVNNDSEYKSVAYGNITGYLIEAIKDLKAEIEELKKHKCNCNGSSK